MIVVLNGSDKIELDKNLLSLPELARDSYVYSLPGDSNGSEKHNSFNDWLKTKLTQIKRSCYLPYS